MIHKFAENPGNPINTFVLPFVFTDKVREAVESIWRCHNPAEHRLILIDNSGEEFSDRNWLEENSHIYIRSYRNLGPAVGFNLGITLSRTDFVTIISDDARLIHESWFINSVARVDRDNTIVSLNSIHPQSVPEDDFYKKGKEYNVSDYLRLSQKYHSFTTGFGLATAIGERDTFIKAGLFPENSYIYTIDGAFAAQAIKNGVNLMFSDIVWHYGDQSHKGRLVEEEKYQPTGTWKDNLVNL